MESKFEREAVKWLKSRGAYVVKLRAGPGTPVGAPDRAFFYRDKWGVIEFKASASSPFQPGQQYTLGFMRDWNPFVYVAHPDNWSLIQEELIANFF